MHREKVEIIIPYYNSMSSIDDAVDSVLSQTIDRWHLTIVNDGSDDLSSKYLDKFTLNENISIISKNNGGVSSARNLGYKSSVSDYVIFLDADDTLNEVYIETFLRDNLNQRNDITIYSYSTYDDGHVVNVSNPKVNDDFAFKYLLGKIKLQTSCFVIKRSFLDEIRVYFDESISWGEDILYFTELLLKSRSTSMYNEFMVNYTITDSPFKLSKFSIAQIKNDIIYNDKILELPHIKTDKRLHSIVLYYRIPAQLSSKFLNNIESLAKDKDFNIAFRRNEEKTFSKVTFYAGLRYFKVKINQYKLKRRIATLF